MIVIDGVDGSGKGVQSRRLLQALQANHIDSILTREPGGSPAAEDIRKLLVEGDPEKWDSLTELLLMYAARRAHLRDTIKPKLAAGIWVISDRFADSSRAFQGIAGELGLDTVELIHRLVVANFKPDLVLILDLPVDIALQRAEARGGKEDRFEQKGEKYHQQVRSAFLQIAAGDKKQYEIINASDSIDQVTEAVFDVVNSRFQLNLTMQSLEK